MRTWSEGHEEEVSSSWICRGAERGALGALKKGEGLKSIGRAFGKPSSCIFAHIRPSGGIMPPVRRRSRLALTLGEREEISRGLAAGRIGSLDGSCARSLALDGQPGGWPQWRVSALPRRGC
jgi:hypothetical protein